MNAVTIRQLSHETQRAFEEYARKSGNTVEEEMRAVLEAHAPQAEPLKIGSELAAFGRKWGGLDIDVKRDQSPIEPAVFE